MAKIGVIAPTEELHELSWLAVREMGLESQVVIRPGNLEAGMAAAREMQSDGVETIVSRGGTADLIERSGLRIPVIPVTLSCKELSQAVFDAKSITGLDRPRIALLSVKNMKQDVALFARVLGADLRMHAVEGNPDNIAQVVETVVREGADIVIGGTYSTYLARQAGFPTVLLPSSTDSLKIALSDAIKMADAIRLEQARTQRFKTLVNHMREGMLYVERTGRIRIANPAAREMLSLGASGMPSQSISDALPLPGITDCLEKGTETLEEVMGIGNATFIVSVTPAHVGHDLSGIIITLQETNRIAKMEEKIRQDLRAKGLTASYRFEDIKGNSPAIRETKRQAAKYAATDSTILIFGETGTGKELFAQSIHNASRHAGGPFVAVNCAALPPSLLESELFGYEEGAFTGANRKGKAGLMELAHGGTLFLDEVSEMDQYGQVRLLRFLQEKQIMRLGGSQYLPVRVRVIAASNRNLRQAVGEGRFREDLFYRLKVLSLSIPPLRQRGGDIRHLAETMLAQWNATLGKQTILSPDAWEALCGHTWPGNVRELTNVMENLAVSTELRLVDAKTIDKILFQEASNEPEELAATEEPGENTEEQVRVTAVLAQCNGNYAQAAEMLGMHRSTLYRKIDRWKSAAQHHAPV